MFDYNIPEHSTMGKRIQNAFIIYGENGSGKTTILRLIHHILSPERNKGHRSAILKVPFETFEVHLTSGHRIIAERIEGYGPGPYIIKVQQDDRIIVKWNFKGSDQGPMNKEQEMRLYSYLRELNLRTYLLQTDRTINIEADSQEDPIYEPSNLHIYRHTFPMMQSPDVRRNIILENAVESVRKWIARRALHGTNIGIESTASIYTEIVQRLVQSPLSRNVASQTAPHMIAAGLHLLSNRSDSFARFQLTSRLDFHQMIDIIMQLDHKSDAFNVITPILLPLIDSLNAGFDALESIKTLTARFIDILNDFYAFKSVSFTLSDGIKFRSDNGRPLEPDELSSGEQHLLLLFCNALVAQDSPTVFIIDEPELSLNIKWQRMLISALLELSKKAPLQFIFASHSIEFIAQHMELVTRLKYKGNTQ